jgi:hypothetical protein
MTLEKICKTCQTQVIIEDNPLVFSEEKTVQKIACPVCQSIIFEGETDGWFFAQTRENYERLKSSNCTFPMP